MEPDRPPQEQARKQIEVEAGLIVQSGTTSAGPLAETVSILDRGERMLKRFPASLVDRLIERSRDLGMHIEANAKTHSISQVDGGFAVKAEVNGEAKQFDVDLVVHGAGRVPNLDGMQLESGDVEYTGAGVKINEYLQSVSNPAVYAAGDCADTAAPPLTPVANQQGRTIAQNLLNGNSETPDYGAVPSAVFTVPALASVGLTQQKAREQGIDFELKEGDMSKWSSVNKVCEPCAAYEILIDKQSDRILGAQLLGPHAEETINLFALAMKFDLTATNLKSVLMTFPTFASDVREMI